MNRLVIITTTRSILQSFSLSWQKRFQTTLTAGAAVAREALAEQSAPGHVEEQFPQQSTCPVSSHNEWDPLEVSSYSCDFNCTVKNLELKSTLEP